MKLTDISTPARRTLVILFLEKLKLQKKLDAVKEERIDIRKQIKDARETLALYKQEEREYNAYLRRKSFEVIKGGICE